MQEGCGAKNRLSGSTLSLLRLSSTEEGETGNGGEEGKSCLTGIEWRKGIKFEMEVEVEIEVEGAESFLKTIYESIKEEQGQEQEEGKGEVNIVLRDGLLYMSIGGSSDEIARLRAVANTWLRLLKIAGDMVEVIASG